MQTNGSIQFAPPTKQRPQSKLGFRSLIAKVFGLSENLHRTIRFIV